MHRSILQTLALVPLLLVVLLVVWAGRRPMPASAPLAKRGAASAPDPLDTVVTLPPTPAPGWQLQGTPVRYDQKTLFDRIDGAAPAYINAGFVYSLGAEYRKQGAKDPVIVDVYYMGTERQALGIYATERDKSYRFVELGPLEGYLASGSSNFWRGRFYVKLAGYEQGEGMDRDLLELGRGLAGALPLTKDKDPALFSLGLLPPGRVAHTDGYSHPPLGDIDGLSQVVYADYPRAGDQTYRLFAVRDESAAAAAGRLGRVKAYFEKDKAKIEESNEGPVRVLVATGEASASLVLVSGEVVAGGIDLPDAKVVEHARTALLQSLSKKIPPPASGPAKEKP